MPVPAGPMPNVTVERRIASTYSFCVTVFGAIFLPRCRQTTASKTSRTSWPASSVPSTASTVWPPIWWPPSTSSTSSSITARAFSTWRSSPSRVSWLPRRRTVHSRRSRSASSTPSLIPASSAATAFETSSVCCMTASVGCLHGAEVVDAGGRLYGHFHAAAGHHDRQRRPAGDPAGAQRLVLRPPVGGRRLRARARDLRPDGRLARRPLRPQADLHARASSSSPSPRSPAGSPTTRSS